MDKERKPEERMNQGPLVPEQVGNLPKTKKKTLIMKMLDAFLVALLVLSSTIVVALFGHHISAIFTGGVSAIFTGGGFAIVKHDVPPEPQMVGLMIPAEHRGIDGPQHNDVSPEPVGEPGTWGD